MPTTWKADHVIISSTFRNLLAEGYNLSQEMSRFRSSHRKDEDLHVNEVFSSGCSCRDSR